MKPSEWEYIQRALQELAKPLTLVQRIKIQRTIAQILDRSADRLEESFVADVDQRLYGKSCNICSQ
jgi:uncharacterized membrane protein YfbV (UPF0208 family)